jgi:hypothetical protein
LENHKTRNGGLHEKLVAVLVVVLIGMNVHEVLQELDGTKVQHNLAGNMVGYYVFIDDAKCLRLFTNTDTDIIDNVLLSS